MNRWKHRDAEAWKNTEKVAVILPVVVPLWFKFSYYNHSAMLLSYGFSGKIIPLNSSEMQQSKPVQ